MGKYRPVNRLIRDKKKGEGKAEVPTKKRFKQILWMASRGDLGKRNLAIIWTLFGSGLRINEVAKLRVRDLLRETNELRTTFIIPASYTKTNKSRAAYILAKPHINAIEEWLREMLDQNICVLENDEFRGLNPDWPIFAITKKGKSWRKMAFRDKKYKDANGNVRTTKVCSSMQTLVSEIFKNSGLPSGTHAGRRTLATWLDQKGVELETIQRILGHSDPDMTLAFEYIDPNFERINDAFQQSFKNIT
ncbi:tyrosine-type recombinase/integrase [Alteromonas gracilis]|uniref:tyrosine-type recombinase/integrase n=1 Tax=Alteromonas gracilis TaxID=1479524 RepID=UPI003735A708